MDTNHVEQIQLSLIFTQAHLESLQEGLAEALPQLNGQSLNSWIDNRISAKLDEHLRRMEDQNPAIAAGLQRALDAHRATAMRKRKDQQ